MTVKKTPIPRGEEEWVHSNGHVVGCTWQGLYQFESTVYWKEKSVVFSRPEIETVKKRGTKKFEMMKGDILLREIKGSDARKGHWIDTPNGERFAIPLALWTEHEYE